MNRYLISLIVALGFVSLASAQEVELTNDSLQLRTDSVGFWSCESIVHDSRVDSLLLLNIRKNKQSETTDGFRLQVYSISGVGAREKAEAVKAEFLSKYPTYDIYVKFQSPDWKVRVGDFRSKSRALKLKHEVRRRFPNAFIVSDQIEFPVLEKKEK